MDATTQTDGAGQATATLTTGHIAGAASATAALSNGHSVGFAVTALAGSPAALTWKVQPSNASANGAIAPMQVAIVDAFGNVTTATTAVTIAVSGGSTAATLGGTLTRS